MMADDSRLERRFVEAIDQVIPPAPWLEAKVIDRLAHPRVVSRSRPRPWLWLDPKLQGAGFRLAAIVMVILLAAAGVAVFAAVHRPSSQTVPGVVGPPRGTIVFGRLNANGDEAIFTIHADGTGEKPLVAPPACCPVWSHKGDRLALSASGPSANSVTTATVNADGSGYRVLPLDSSGLNLGPGAWSPDDSRMAFQGWDDTNPSRSGIYTADASNGGDRRRITSTTTTEVDTPLSYSPDGSRILFWRGPGNNVSGQPAGQLFVVGVSGGAVTQVSPPGMTVWACCFYGAAGGWSPDGSRIAFSAFSPNSSDPGRSAVFVAAGDGTNVSQISAWGSYTTSARWSPTGSWILFDRLSYFSAHELYLIHPDGSGAKLIPIPSLKSTGICCGVWSPDGNRIVFPHGPGPSDESSDLWTVEVDGSHLTRLTNTLGYKLTDIGWGGG